jgi:hypothetical protein
MWTTQAWFTILLSLLAYKDVLSHSLKSVVNLPSPVDGMQSIRETFINCSVSPDVANVMSSWRQGTKKKYNV